jgi:cell division transport system permease protein
VARKKPFRGRGATTHRTGIGGRLIGWGDEHVQALRFSLGKFRQTPISSVMTSLVIAIALALPATLSMMLNNALSISASWGVSSNVTLYLHSEIDDAGGAALARKLAGNLAIESTRIIGRDEALATFRTMSGFGEVLDALDENPLPTTIVLRPRDGFDSAQQLESLASELEQLEQVETAQVDLQWIQRLNAILDFVRRGVLIVGSLLGLAVLLIVGNTIRLDIYSRREEIVVIKLIGATNAFVRRPFLYGGLIYGFFGGALSALFVIIALRFLAAPSTYLASLYGSTFKLVDINAEHIVLLIALSTLLGLVGSWISVSRHLSEIEPK